MNTQQTQQQLLTRGRERSRTRVAGPLAAVATAAVLTLAGCGAPDTAAQAEPVLPDHLVERADGGRMVAEPVLPDHLVERADGGPQGVTAAR